MFIRLQHLRKKDGKAYEYVQVMESPKESGGESWKPRHAEKPVEIPDQPFEPIASQRRAEVKPMACAPYGVLSCVHHIFSESGL